MLVTPAFYCCSSRKREGSSGGIAVDRRIDGKREAAAVLGIGIIPAKRESLAGIDACRSLLASSSLMMNATVCDMTKGNVAHSRTTDDNDCRGVKQ